MRILVAAAVAVASVALGGCGDLLAGGGSSKPPREIVGACTSLGTTGYDPILTTEWIKPIATRQHRVRWEKADPGFVMRSDRPNPLTGETDSLSVLFVPVQTDLSQAPWCKSAYEPSNWIGIDGVERPGIYLTATLYSAHMAAIRAHGPQTPGQSVVLADME